MKNTMSLAFAVVLGGGIGSTLGAAFHQVATGVAVRSRRGNFRRCPGITKRVWSAQDELLKRYPILSRKTRNDGHSTDRYMLVTGDSYG